MSRRDRIAAHFKQLPNRWIDGEELRGPGGRYAWRTRLSECRRELGMDIENRERKIGQVTVSEYRYVPEMEDGTPILRGHDTGFSLR